MPGSPRDMITSAERRFPVRVRIGVPAGGLGQRHTQINAWLDENCGADCWAMTPSGTRGVLNDALSIYFADATLASALVVRWCVESRLLTACSKRNAHVGLHRREQGRCCDTTIDTTKRADEFKMLVIKAKGVSHITVSPQLWPPNANKFRVKPLKFYGLSTLLWHLQVHVR